MNANGWALKSMNLHEFLLDHAARLISSILKNDEREPEKTKYNTLWCGRIRTIETTPRKTM